MIKFLFLGNLGLVEVLILIPIILWLIAIIKLISTQYPDNTTKAVWALVILLIPVLGAIIYLLAGSPNKNPKNNNSL